VLDVDRSDDVDARVHEIEHVFVSFGVARARHIRVRQLIHDDDFGLARPDGVNVHFLERYAVVVQLLARHGLQVAHQCFRVGPAVRLDEAQHDIDIAGAERLRLLQHAVGLTNACGRPNVDFETAALASLQQLQKIFAGTFRHIQIIFLRKSKFQPFGQLRFAAPQLDSSTRTGSTMAFKPLNCRRRCNR
jgi:hypothetical protein